ncbi:MAG: hypothetical protein HYT70_04550 [Candidatus Aenigmarchaeota archaeon]|nr:hypothetical protein [Candidatus Aenigmarchaeota archaeon]
MTTTSQLYLPIKGMQYSVIPEVSLLGKDLWEAQLYAQDNGLVVLSSPDINRLARAVKGDNPDRQFLRYAREQAEKQGTSLNDNDAKDGYKRLHDGLWKQYVAIAREILVWTRDAQPINHPMIVLKDMPVTSHLITDYRVEKQGDGYRIVEAVVTSANWMKEDGAITPEMAQLLGAEPNTHVWTNPNPDYENGLRALGWDFRGRERPYLVSDWEPWDRNSYGGSLLGRRL